jgi:hypothetical protein
VTTDDPVESGDPTTTLLFCHLTEADNGGPNPVNTKSGSGIIELSGPELRVPVWTQALYSHAPVAEIRESDEPSAHGISVELEVVCVCSSGNKTATPFPSVNAGAIITPASWVSVIPISLASSTTIVSKFTKLWNFWGLGMGFGLTITLILIALIALAMFSIDRGWSALAVGATQIATLVGWRKDGSNNGFGVGTTANTRVSSEETIFS